MEYEPKVSRQALDRAVRAHFPGTGDGASGSASDGPIAVARDAFSVYDLWLADASARSNLVLLADPERLSKVATERWADLLTADAKTAVRAAHAALTVREVLAPPDQVLCLGSAGEGSWESIVRGVLALGRAASAGVAHLSARGWPTPIAVRDPSPDVDWATFSVPEVGMRHVTDVARTTGKKLPPFVRGIGGYGRGGS